MTISCATCRFAVPVIDTEKGTSKIDGFCYRWPPALLPPASSAYPPVALDRFWCGEHQPKEQPRETRTRR